MKGFSGRASAMIMSLCFSATVLAGSSEQARELLEQMTTAMSQMNYQGTFVYVRNGDVQSMRITHVTDDNGVRERLYSLSGPRREVIRDRKGVRCVLQDSSSVLEDQLVAPAYFPELPLSMIDGQASGYRLETGGEARIAGQTARRVSITPVDSYRYGYDFWLEKRTGLLLKWVLFDSNHKTLAKLMFTEFKMGSAVDWSELESDTQSGEFVELKTFSPEKTVVTHARPRWQPRKLPPGFELTSHSHQPTNGSVFEHMVYSDGLASVSVYIEDSDEHVTQGHEQLGTNNAYSKKLGEFQITVIGEVPEITVRSIANEMALSVAAN